MMPAHERSLQITDAYRDHLLGCATRPADRRADWRDSSPSTTSTRTPRCGSLAPPRRSRPSRPPACASPRLPDRVPALRARPARRGPCSTPPLRRRQPHRQDARRGARHRPSSPSRRRSAPARPRRRRRRGPARRPNGSRSPRPWHTARAALGDGIRTDERIVGWHRVTAGGCGACLAAATRTYATHEPLRVHDGCRCGAEPVVATSRPRPRPTATRSSTA
jgi:hypothetical protein